MWKGIIVLIVAAGAVLLAWKLSEDEVPLDGGEKQTEAPPDPESGEEPAQTPKETLMTEIDPKQVEAVGLDHETAVKAARAALESLAGKAEVPVDASVVVSKKAAQHEVVFKITLPPHVRGPDYAAKVTLDAETGEIIQILGSS